MDAINLLIILLPTIMVIQFGLLIKIRPCLSQIRYLLARWTRDRPHLITKCLPLHNNIIKTGINTGGVFNELVSLQGFANYYFEPFLSILPMEIISLQTTQRLFPPEEHLSLPYFHPMQILSLNLVYWEKM